MSHRKQVSKVENYYFLHLWLEFVRGFWNPILRIRKDPDRQCNTATAI